jgi:hypothetical protein
MRTLLVATCLLLAGSTLQAQPYQSSVASVDSIIATLYSVISGNAGEERNWDKFLYLFAPQASLIATARHDSLGYSPRTITPAEYAERMGRIKPGFVEAELSRRTETYGTLTHVWSTYATMAGRDMPVNNRGINSIQLLRDNQRYYILSIVWCSEELGFPLPEKYL